MQIELNDGKSVRFVNGGSLRGAAYDFNVGSNIDDHLHVYLSLLSCSHGFEFLCAERSLAMDERNEAERLVQEKIAIEGAQQNELLQRLLANTDGTIEQMQGSVHDKCDAPVHVRRALGFDLRRGSKPTQRSWADVKAEIARLRREVVAG